jgi:predicted DNA-binding transcriptional regulator AlpA
MSPTITLPSLLAAVQSGSVPSSAVLLKAAQVAALINVTPKRVYELGIPHLYLSPRSIRWRYSDVIAWIDEATLTPKAA